MVMPPCGRPPARLAARTQKCDHMLSCHLVGEYEFADARILRGVYRRDSALLGRNMLLEGRFFGLRFYFGVRVTGVIDEERDAGDGPERV
jgi:hypothetical protein